MAQIFKIRRSVYREILSQAMGQLPDESCGYLLGTGEEATVSYPMTNVDHSPEHFSFDPKEQFAALRYARSAGVQIIGNWHSHPASPSRPSQEDIRLAYDPTISYWILSLADELPVLNAFLIRDGKVEKCPVEIVDDAGQ
jgi:proteasome lid subunit RPN8/RPN11